MSTQEYVEALDKIDRDKLTILTALVAHDVPTNVADKIANHMKIFSGGPRAFDAANIPHNYRINHIVDRPPEPPRLVVVYSPMPEGYAASN